MAGMLVSELRHANEDSLSISRVCMHATIHYNTGIFPERMLNYPKLAQSLPGPLYGAHLAPARVVGAPTGKQTFQIRCMSAVADFQAMQVELQRLCDAVAHYASTHITVKGTERLLKRAQRDLASTNYLAHEENAGSASSQASTDCVASLAAEAQLQGARNNLRGMQAELDVAQQATNVVCLGAKFYSQVSAGMLSVRLIKHAAFSSSGNHLLINLLPKVHSEHLSS